MKRLKALGGAAVVFGALTILSGGVALFGTPAQRATVGNAVPFVLWFNFIAGFFYVAAGVGLIGRKGWASPLAVALAAATVTIFWAFGLTIAAGTPYEMRTIGAMTLRAAFWIGTAVAACKVMGCGPLGARGD